MSGQTIRDVIIKIAIEQKAAALKVPDTSAITAAMQKINATPNGDVEKVMSKRATDAERAYDQEASAAIAAYSKIMRAREAAADKEKQLLVQTQSTQSAVLSGYAAGAAAALQMAKGIAFVVAANDEQAESFVRAIAKAQGYFDLAVGGINVVKTLNDVQRQSALLLELQAAASAKAAAGNVAIVTTSAAAAVGTTTVAAGATAAGGAMMYLAKAGAFAGAVLSKMFTPLTVGFAAVAVVAAVATKAIIYWSGSSEREAKKAADALEKSTGRQVSALERIAAQSRELASAGSASNIGDDQSAIAGQLETLKAAREQLQSAAGKIDTRSDDPAKRQSAYEQKNRLQSEAVAILNQEKDLQGQIVEGKKAEQAAAQQILRTAQDTLASEENRNRSENARLGLMTRADQATAKRLLDQKAAGKELSVADARKAQSLGILSGDVEAAGAKEAKRLGLDKSREGAGETRPLEQARRDVKSAQNTAGEAIKQLDDEIKEASKQQKELAEKLVQAIRGKFATSEALAEVIQVIEDEKTRREKQTFFQARGWSK
jgi:membrane protein implicated in regulation of membrane protease activity